MNEPIQFETTTILQFTEPLVVEMMGTQPDVFKAGMLDSFLDIAKSSLKTACTDPDIEISEYTKQWTDVVLMLARLRAGFPDVPPNTIPGG